MRERIVRIENEENQINYTIYVNYLSGAWNICKRAHLGWDDCIDSNLWKEVISEKNSNIQSLLLT